MAMLRTLNDDLSDMSTCLFHGYLNGLTDKDSDEELNLNLIEIKSKILMEGK